MVLLHISTSSPSAALVVAGGCFRRGILFKNISASFSTSSHKPLRYAVLGAGFAGLSVTWHLLQHSPKENHVCIDIYDDVGIGGGASGVSGGLLHPYSPKVKPLWRSMECWKESLKLLSIAEAAVESNKLNAGSQESGHGSDDFVVRRRGIIRPAVSLKNLDLMKENAQNCLASCRVEFIDKEAAERLVPDLCVPFNLAFYMPEAVNVHPQRYLELHSLLLSLSTALYSACQNLVKDVSVLGLHRKELNLHKKAVTNLLELSGEYDSVIICLGARAAFLPELSERLPLRTCRGVIAQLQLPDDNRESYAEHGPSILSDAWIAIHGPHNVRLGSTWEWKSRNYSQDVAVEEASKALEELLPKASAIYPGIKNWKYITAKAGLRAMPPLTSHGSLPLLACIDEYLIGKQTCKFWLFTGLGSRGLLYHGWLGKLMAQAVVSCSEDVFPPELVAWKSRMK
ncbi:DAO domain-containing protein [Heracleum sosnowskyi]|uniref:DAO domain-containing protein n=1 Tax=Heracleum sosnowskyi TaxID=360622 RepID=A0AAD8N4P3_9APIA|nr:DAO domain-containing protein [Heracleum sosnowskyi]